MPKYVASTLLEFDVNKVADSMREMGAKVLELNTTPNSKRSGGRILLECEEELAGRLEKLDGIKHFEKEILHRIY